MAPATSRQLTIFRPSLTFSATEEPEEEVRKARPARVLVAGLALGVVGWALLREKK